MQIPDISRRRILQLTAGVGATSILPTHAAAQGGTIDYGETVSGTITTDDPVDPNWSSYHTEPWDFSGSDGDQITVELSLDSNDDPYIHVVNPDGDDIIDEEASSRTVTISEDGEYTIYPQAFGDEAPGDYTLTLEGSGSESDEEDEEEEDDTEEEETEDFEDVGEDPAYVVEANSLAASPTRAIFSMKVEPQESVMFEDYESGSVSGLELNLSHEDLRIARITPLPKEDGDLFDAGGTVLLAGASILGGPATAAAASTVSLVTGSIEIAQEIQEKNIESSEGTRSALFSGDSFGGNQFLDDTVKYLVEVESTGPPISEISYGSFGWSSQIHFSYKGEPQQPSSSTDISTKSYTPKMEGELDFVDH